LAKQNTDTAKKRYRDFVESVENEKIENPSDDALGGVVLGRVDFVNWVEKTFLSKESNSKEIPQLKILKPSSTPDAIIQAVCDEFGCGLLFSALWTFDDQFAILNVVKPQF